MNDVTKLSRFFAALVRAAFTADELAEVNRLNSLPERAGSCATHDFTDANALIYGAFCALMFREPDAGDEDDADLMNEAWDAARASGFTL